MIHRTTTARLGAVAVMASIALLASGCGASTTNANASGSTTFSKQASGTLRTDGFTPGDEVATTRVDYTAKKLPKVKLSINKGNFDPQKFTAEAASGSVPDIVDMNRSDIATYAAKGLILNLDACYALYNVKPSTRFYPAVADSVTYKNSVFGVPQFWQTSALMLNMRLLSKAGLTEADFDTSNPARIGAAVKKLSVVGANGAPTVLGLDPNMPGNASTWFAAFGGRIMDAAGKPTLDNANNVKALEFLKQVFDAEGGYDKATSFKNTFDYFGNDNQFAKDQVAAELNQQWYPNVLTGNTAGVDISATALKDASGKAFGAADGDALAIPTAAKNKNAACAWAMNMTSDDAWVAATKARLAKVASTKGALFTGLFTGSQTADKIIASQYQKPTGIAGFDSTIKAFESGLANGVNLGSSAAGLQINTELQDAVVPALEGNKSAAEVLKAAQSAALQDYNSAKK